MEQNTDNQSSIAFPKITKSATISKSVKVIDLINKKVQITYSLN